MEDKKVMTTVLPDGSREEVEVLLTFKFNDNNICIIWLNFNLRSKADVFTEQILIKNIERCAKLLCKLDSVISAYRKMIILINCQIF